MDGTRAEELVERYADAILRIGYTWLGDMDDAKDICQTVLIKLVEEGRRFPDLGQERAWVVRLSVNACKNWKKSAWFRRRAPLEEGLHLAAEVPEPEDGAPLALEARRLSSQTANTPAACGGPGGLRGAGAGTGKLSGRSRRDRAGDPLLPGGGGGGGEPLPAGAGGGTPQGGRGVPLPHRRGLSAGWDAHCAGECFYQRGGAGRGGGAALPPAGIRRRREEAAAGVLLL
ncbi:MAG: RNA polymerase sigma factor [Flavonifractor plautii]